MKNLYEDICNQCNNYIYDTKDMHQHLFQRIYNASTILYFKSKFSKNESTKENNKLKTVMLKIDEVLNDILFPEEKEENIRNILINSGFDADKLLVETPDLNVTEYNNLLSCE